MVFAGRLGTALRRPAGNYELPYQHDVQPAWTVGTEHDRLFDISRT